MTELVLTLPTSSAKRLIPLAKSVTGISSLSGSVPQMQETAYLDLVQSELVLERSYGKIPEYTRKVVAVMTGCAVLRT
jgi:hypothetical protein